TRVRYAATLAGVSTVGLFTAAGPAGRRDTPARIRRSGLTRFFRPGNGADAGYEVLFAAATCAAV
ncbi:MAG: hypothetical protein ACRD2A_11270, partial [Vicinamibacterales bacterium]